MDNSLVAYDKLPVFTTATVVGGEENDFIDESSTSLLESQQKVDNVFNKKTKISLKKVADDLKLTSEKSFYTSLVNQVPEKSRNAKNTSNMHEKRIKCNRCDRKFIKKFLYEAHIQSEHGGLKKPFQCSLCNIDFRMYYYLTRHMRETHAESAGFDSTLKHSNLKASNTFRNECMICCKVFKRKEHLKSHHQSVHLGIRPFKCAFCERSFATRKTCRVHEMGHTGERPYVCDRCEKAFRQKSELKVHLEIHTENRQLLCPICKRMKRTHEELNAHIQSHVATQQHQCPKCGRIFKKLSHLNEHDKAVHLKLRPYKCSYCKLSFALAKTCRNHERTHTGERPEKCTICGQAFKQKSVLSNHVKRYHTQEQLINTQCYS